MTYRKKLIEVSLPLEAINEESAREKSIRHGHPSTLHLWWARRPLAACRAVLWSSLVDDPSEYMPDEESANRERDRLFAILEKLVKWENINNEIVLDAAKLEIARSVARELGCEVPVGKQAINDFLVTKAPPVLDPFAGGGSIPLEAQRLGLRAYASDLNPVAVLINKALIEIPPKFADLPPVHPTEPRERQGTFLKKEWKGAQGLAEDVRYYGKWMRDEAEKRIQHLYPKVKITTEMLTEREDLRKIGLKADDELTVIAWLWARTVKCPNPACSTRMPLVKSFTLSTIGGKQYVLEPVINSQSKPPTIRFKVSVSKGSATNGTVNRSGARCIVCNSPVPFDHVRNEGRSGNMSIQMTAIIAEGPKGMIYLSPIESHIKIVDFANPSWLPETELTGKAAVNVPLYGMRRHGDLFTHRQLNALISFSNLVNEAKQRVKDDYRNSHHNFDIDSYSEAIATYLAFGVDRSANYWSSLTPWGGGFIVQTFGRQALAMVWDFAEANPFSESTGNWLGAIEWICRCLDNTIPAIGIGQAIQKNAMDLTFDSSAIICTDPPYYDNISYADLSDYFYVWIRRSLDGLYAELFSTMLVPKSDELIATPYRFGGDKKKAEIFFENGLRKFFASAAKIQKIAYPFTIFYAFKQSENDEGIETTTVASTGWETMLEGLLDSNLMIDGTWPLRTERDQGLKTGQNVLASSIVLVCRPRMNDAENITRRDFLTALKKELIPALHQLQHSNIAPVDLAQAAIGPGMAIFSRYKAVLEADGTPMRVRAALALINQSLDEYLAEQEGEYDGDTRWALAWFEQYGHEQGSYGVAETLSKAKNTSVEGLSHAGFLEARAGKVRLLKRDELDDDWDPNKDKRLTAWETAQYLIRTLDKEGEKGAGALLGKLGSFGEMARDLAYRLYTICERKGWAQEALAYNMLVVAWPRIKEQSGKGPRQESLL